jgi:type 1 glutamine amidotransferase
MAPHASLKQQSVLTFSAMNPSSETITRRTAVQTLSLGALLASFPALMRGQPAPDRKKILFFTKSSGYEHGAIADGPLSDKVGYGIQGMKEICSALNVDLTVSKDGSLFSPEYIAGFDGLVFFTSGDLLAEGTDKHPPMTKAGKAALLDAVKAGKGFIGLHSAGDTFHTNETVKTNTKGSRGFRYKNYGDKIDPYLNMLGGEFIIHGKQQMGTARVVDPKFPGFGKIGTDFRITEEWYTLKDFRPDLHVILVLDPAGMEGEMYQRAPFPSTWAHRYGQGRVFYSSLAHRSDTWESERYRSMISGALTWMLGRVDADISPNLSTVAPDANQLAPLPKA